MADALALIAWVCVALQAYHFVLYPLAVIALSRLAGRRSETRVQETPRISLIVSAFDEAGVIPDKVRNSLSLLPAPCEIIVVTDGSTDDTPQAAAAASADATLPVRVLHQAARAGKSAAMNRGAAEARGEILVFSDANAFYGQSALGALAAGFSEDEVAVVGGAKHVVSTAPDSSNAAFAASDGLYWRYEAAIREAESRLGATVASVGEILAIRRRDWRPIPGGIVNDDAWITMSTLARGRDVRFARAAVSVEEGSASFAADAVRRRRMTAGRMGMLARADIWPWRRPFVLTAFLSHKVLRLFLPVLMAGGYAATLVALAAAPSRRDVQALAILQTAVVLLILLGAYGLSRGRRIPIAHVAFFVARSAFAAVPAAIDLLGRRDFTVWEKPRR